MLEELRREACEANLLLPRYGLIHLTFGNASALDRERGILAIKPSGVAYEELRPAGMVLVDLEGKVVEGEMRPSSDTPTHVCLYRAFSEIRGVVHTHSRFATAFAQAGMPVPCYGTTHADYFRGEIPVTRALTPAEIQGEYEWETGRVISERFVDLDPAERPGVLVRGHGPFAWGPSGNKAAENACAVELLAEMAFCARQLNPGILPLDPILRDRHFLRKHGSSAYYGQV